MSTNVKSEMKANTGLLVAGTTLAVITIVTVFQGPFDYVNAVLLGVLSVGVLAAAVDQVRTSAYFAPVIGGGFVLFGAYWILFQVFSLWALLLVASGVGILGWRIRERDRRT